MYTIDTQGGAGCPNSNAVCASTRHRRTRKRGPRCPLYIEQLLYEQQLAEVIEQGGSEEDLMTEEQLEAQREAEKQEVLNTIVYCVYNDAIYYHANKICGTQTNGRELTVEEAMSEGLGACKTCNPPVWID